MVASDEDNTLRLYHRDQGGAALHEFALDSFLEVGPKRREVDIEGAAALGGRSFWIGSHGRSRKGKLRPNRTRFFAVKIEPKNGETVVSGSGRPYKDLLQDLLQSPELASFDLARAAEMAPNEAGALNIEGLAATPDGRLLIGFRSPVPNGKALVVPLENPHQVVEGQAARLGSPVLLDLGGSGVRSFEWVPEARRFLIVAGPHADGGPLHLYDWTGEPSDAPVSLTSLPSDLRPEALLHFPGESATSVLLLSDDGSRKIAGTPCKALDASRRRFRGTWLDLK